jgi:hypothetical protein
VLLSVSNKVEVARQIKINRLFFWIGIIGLAAAMGILFVNAGNPYLVFLGYPFLILGLILSKRGSFNNRRHGVGGYKVASEDALIANALDGVPPRYHLYSWIKLGGLSIDHLLVTPGGLMIIKACSQMGDFKMSNDVYRRKAGLATWFATVGEPSIGNPTRELNDQIKKLREWFAQKGLELPVDGVVVFMLPRTKILEAAEMSYPVCKLDQLKLAIRGWETDLNMTVPQQQQVEDYILEALPTGVAEEARTLAQLPSYKRAALLSSKQAAEKSKTATKEKAAEKPAEPAAPKPRLTPEERERLRLERIKAAQEKGRQGVNPYKPLEPGMKMGKDGKVREVKPSIVEKKPPRRRVEPLHRPTPGAFGERKD